MCGEVDSKVVVDDDGARGRDGVDLLLRSFARREPLSDESSISTLVLRDLDIDLSGVLDVVLLSLLLLLLLSLLLLLLPPSSLLILSLSLSSSESVAIKPSV